MPAVLPETTPVIGFHDPLQYIRVRELFDRCGFTRDKIVQLVRPHYLIAQHRQAILDKLDNSYPLNVLVKLLVLCDRLPRAAVEMALCPMTLDEWIEAGILSIDGPSVVANHVINAQEDLFIAFDNLFTDHVHPDHVPGVSGTSGWLYKMTLRHQVDRTLDLCCGNGIQAMLAARHSNHVVGTDLNGRSLDFARFSATLNELDNIEFLEGSTFDPVRGQTFDLIVTNPPFVVSPESDYLFRDNDMQLDEFVKSIANDIPDYLNENGFGQILCNWIQTSQESWQDRLKSWFADKGCDVFVLCNLTHSPKEYVEFWKKDEADMAGFEDRSREWIDYLYRNDVESVSLGLITIRKRTSGIPNWFQSFNWIGKIQKFYGPELATRFGVMHYLSSNPTDDEMMKTRFVFPQDTRLSQHCSPNKKCWQTESAMIERPDGIAKPSQVDSVLADMLLQCNGDRTLENVLQTVQKKHQVNLFSSIHENLKAVRLMLYNGFLTPVELETF